MLGWLTVLQEHFIDNSFGSRITEKHDLRFWQLCILQFHTGWAVHFDILVFNFLVVLEDVMSDHCSLFLGKFLAELRKVPAGLATSVCLHISVASNLMDLLKIWYWKLLLKYVKHLEICLKLDRNSDSVHEDLCEFRVVESNIK